MKKQLEKWLLMILMTVYVTWNKRPDLSDLPDVTTHANTSLLYSHIHCYSEHGRLVYQSRFPQSGGACLCSCLMQSQNKSTSLQSPLSAGRKFSVVRRRRSHCVSSTIITNKQHVINTQCFGMEIQTERNAGFLARPASHWQVCIMGISFVSSWDILL